MDFRIFAFGVGIASATLIGTHAQAASNLLTNGSFENHIYVGPPNITAFPGWTVNSGSFPLLLAQGLTPAPLLFGRDNVRGPQSGNIFLEDLSEGTDTVLSQTFMDVAGKTYRVSGYEASDGGANTNFSLSIDSTVFGAGSPIPHTRWIQYSTTFVGTGSDTLSIASSVTDGFVAFDNFKVTAVPEPDAWALMIVGLGLTGAAIRIARRGRTNVVGAV